MLWKQACRNTSDQMNTPYASGALWVHARPTFNADAPAEMGWQSKLVPNQIYRLGIVATDEHCKKVHGSVFAGLDNATRDEVLKQLEAGAPQFESVPAKMFFSFAAKHQRRRLFLRPDSRGQQRHGRLDLDRLSQRAR